MGPKKTVLTYYATTCSYGLFTGSAFLYWILFFICIISFILLKEFPTQNFSIKNWYTFSNKEVGRFGSFELRTYLLKLLCYYNALLAKLSLIIHDWIKWHCSSSFISRNAISSKNKFHLEFWIFKNCLNSLFFKLRKILKIIQTNVL